MKTWSGSRLRGRRSAERIGGYAGILVIALGLGARHILAEDPSAPCPKDERRGEHGCFKNPRLTHRVAPKYPPHARSEHAEGSVTFYARVETDGSVSVLKIAKCTNEGHGFEAAARDALKKWRYEPGTRNGEVVAVEFTVAIEFSLK